MATILIVDDRPTYREHLKTLLGYGGNRLLEAADGAEALVTARAEHPDLIIADILMPTMDGHKFVRQLRADSQIAATKVVFCTAHYHENEARHLAGACGVTHILTRPCEPVVVQRTVEAALGAAVAPSPPAEQFDLEHLRLVTDKLSQKADELRKANGRLTALIDFGLEVGSEREPRRLLQSFCKKARAIIGARYAIAGIWNSVAKELKYVLVSGMDAAETAHLGLPDPTRGPIATVLRDVRCLRLENPSGNPAAANFPCAYPPLQAWLGAPIVSPRQVHGWLELIDKIGASAFNEEDERLAGILAAQVGRLYENGSVYAEMHQHAAKLELEIVERKRAEKALSQAQKMEAVGRLAGGVAHDFNNLLTVINGYGELVLDKLPVADPTRGLIRQIVAAGDRAAGLTRQLLAFSRKAINEPKTLDLKAVVADVHMILRRKLGEDIQLAVVVDPELAAVKADSGQIEQAIMNLAVNARDAMPRGGCLTIELRNTDLDRTYVLSHPEARQGPHVLMAITDSGCGMNQETMARLFEPFFSTKGERGSGLGLATVYGIIKQSGGHIAVYSELGRGTTFKIYLPRTEKGLPHRLAELGSTVVPQGNETVLVAEDEDAVRALSRHVLQASGYTVLEARDGAEALRVASRHGRRIDLLITDVILPRLGGREVAARLAALNAGVKVLFLSGYADDGVLRHGILEAHVAFLQKPFTPASLAAKVRQVLDSQ
jgi:signal transduction histidine kinase/CheY-like chemotaxis protein